MTNKWCITITPKSIDIRIIASSFENLLRIPNAQCLTYSVKSKKSSPMEWLEDFLVDIFLWSLLCYIFVKIVHNQKRMDCNNTVSPVHKFLKKGDLCQPPNTGITLNEEKHEYLFKGKSLKGYTSTTSLTGKLNPFPRYTVAANIAKRNNKFQWESLSKTRQQQLMKEVTDEWDDKIRYGTRVHNMIENYLVVGKQYIAPPIDSKEYVALERAMMVIRALEPTHGIETCEIKFKDDRRKITGCADVLLKRKGQKRFEIIDASLPLDTVQQHIGEILQRSLGI